MRTNMQATMQAPPCVSTPSGSTVVQRLAAGSDGATRTTRLPEACAMELAASAFATALTSNRPSSAMVRASAAARRDDAVAVATITEWAASVSYAQGRSGSWGYWPAALGEVTIWYAATRLNAAR
jgi:hypothetical protein